MADAQANVYPKIKWHIGIAIIDPEAQLGSPRD